MKRRNQFKKNEPADTSDPKNNLQGKKDSSYRASAVIFFWSFIALVVVILLLLIDKNWFKLF